ncbi:hypothetical protein FRC00_003506 [Tulasnella sp. 408]|nr:hypothetical protein FRC00_003506 [Tulasnella sp. 408]
MPRPQASRGNNKGNGRGGEETEARHKAEILALDRHPLINMACIKVEQAELNERRVALKAKLGKLKVKREGSPIQVPRNAAVEVIDLTLEYVQVYFGLHLTPEELRRELTQRLAGLL